MLWLYALADAIDRVDVAGVCGEPPIVLTSSACAIVAGWIEQRPSIDRDSLTRQDALVRRVHAIARAVLPVRFGTFVSDAEAAIRIVDSLGAAVVRERLDLVRDREQMTLRITGAAGASGASGALGAVRFTGAAGATGAGATGAAGAAGAAGPGTRYLEQRAGREVAEGIRPILLALERLARATRVEPGQRSDVTTAYQLIDRGTADRHRELIEKIAVQHPMLRVRVSGPLPPYAFADLATR